MSERVYKLLNGSELLVSEEVMGVRIPPDGMPITVDGDYVIDDVLKLVDVGNEAARELEYAKKQAGIWNDEAVRLRKELEIKDSTIETLTKQITDEVAISATAMGEIVRICKELEDAKQETKKISALLGDDTAGALTELYEYYARRYAAERDAAMEVANRYQKELEEAQKQSAKWEKAFDNADKQYLKKEQEAGRFRKEAEAWQIKYLGARKHLEWYGDTQNYEQEVVTTGDDPLDVYYECPEVLNDRGMRARAYLVGQEGEGEQS